MIIVGKTTRRFMLNDLLSTSKRLVICIKMIRHLSENEKSGKNHPLFLLFGAPFWRPFIHLFYCSTSFYARFRPLRIAKNLLLPTADGYTEASRHQKRHFATSYILSEHGQSNSETTAPLFCPARKEESILLRNRRIKCSEE